MSALPLWFMVSFAAVLGAVLGSFLNVVIGRVPQGESILGRSHCPNCGNAIRERHNVPLLGWLILRGRCADCRCRISIRYPLIESLTAVLFAVIVLHFGLQPVTAVLLIFACMSVALAFIDWDTMRLPNSIVLTVGPVVIAGSTIVAYAADGMSGVWGVLAGAGVTFAVYALLWLVTLGRGLGMGDVKLAPTLGAVAGLFGWTTVVVALAASWLIGAAVAVVGLTVGFVRPRQPFPFGPYLLIGTWVGVFFAEPISRTYLSLFSLS